MSCSDIPSLLDLQNNKKHIDDFGRLMGTGEGDSTNEVTGQVRPTYNKVMKSVGFKPGSGDFTTGFTVMPGERDIAWYDPVSLNWYSYLGVIPTGGYNVAPGTNPVGDNNWSPQTDELLRSQLASNSGAGLVGTSLGTVQSDIDELYQFVIASDSADYRDRNIQLLSRFNFKLRTKAALKILCQGDSETFGWDPTSTDATGTNLTRQANVTYPGRLGRYLSKCTGANVTTVTRAVSGQTAQQGYEYPAWQTNPDCDLAIIMYAINDSTSTAVTSYMEYMEKFIRRMIDWGMGVIILQPIAGGNEQHGNTQTFQIWGQEARNMANIYGCSNVEANEVPYNIPYGSIASDAIHFNSMGYQRLAESIASMIMAGGLLQNHRKLSTEITVWPYKQSDQIGFYDTFGNLTMGFGSGALTLQGIIGGFDAGKYVRTSYSFYLDAEAAEVDVVGVWTDSSKLYFQFSEDQEVPPSSGVAYYPLSLNNSFVQSDFNAIQSTLHTARNRGSNNHNDSISKRVGTLVGRGWKTISIFNATDSSSTEPAYVQAVTIRPVYRHLARQTNSGFGRGYVETSTLRYPSPIVTGNAWPAEVTLGAIDLPLPANLHAQTFDQVINPWDCGTAKLVIKSIGGTHGNNYLEALIRRTSGGVDGYTVDILHSTGVWPNITARIGAFGQTNIYSQNQVATGMPQRDIKTIAPYADTSAASVYGHILRLVFDWGGSPKNGYYTIELQSSSDGSGATTAVGY